MTSAFDAVTWDDLRICLEVKRAGAVSTAARHLGLSHSTVLRRIAAMERTLGVILFVKRTNGYAATDAGRDLAEAAEQVEAKIANAIVKAAAFEGGMADMIRLAVPDLAATVLMPLLAAFCAAHPDVEISLLAAQTPESLTRGDAHIALALTKSPPAGQIGVDLGEVAFAPYAARSALDQDKEQDLPWIGLTSGLRHTPVGGFDRVATAARHRLHRVDSLTMQYSAIAGGLGVGLLPCAVGDLDARLHRCGEPVTDSSQRLWLLHRHEMKGNVRIMTFFRHLRVALTRERPLIVGERPIP